MRKHMEINREINRKKHRETNRGINGINMENREINNR